MKFEEKSFEQIQQNAQMILNSDSAPDILEYNKGNATAGLLSKQGLLTDLTDEATKRGWDKALSPSLQTTAKYDDDGIMGSGKFFGIPNYGEYVMVYYNKDLFAKYKHRRARPRCDEFDRGDGHVRQEPASPRCRSAAPNTPPSRSSTSWRSPRPTAPSSTTTSSTRTRSTSTARSSPTARRPSPTG